MKEVLSYHAQHSTGYCASCNIKVICLPGHFHMVVGESTFVPQIWALFELLSQNS